MLLLALLLAACARLAAAGVAAAAVVMVGAGVHSRVVVEQSKWRRQAQATTMRSRKARNAFAEGTEILVVLFASSLALSCS